MELINFKKASTVKTKINTNSTAEEKMIWNHLKDRKLLDLKFRKQEKIKNYQINFYCPEIEFGIEIDDNSHTKKYEKTKNEYMESIGIKLIKFTSSFIKNNLEEVLKEIELFAKNLKV